MEMTLRPAEHRDLDALVRLLEALFEIEADFAFDPARQRTGLRRLMDEGRGKVLVAEQGGEIAGMVTVQTVISTAEGGPVGWVEDLVVAEGFRGRGIGQKLLQGIEDWAASNGLTRLQLLADRNNAPALGFYERQGWTGTALIALRKYPKTADDPEGAEK